MELDNEITSYGNARGYVLKYLQEQFKSRILLRNGLYETIPTTSKFRSTITPTYLSSLRTLILTLTLSLTLTLH